MEKNIYTTQVGTKEIDSQHWISEDNGETFHRYSTVPVMSRSEYDPCLVTSPNVFIDDDTWKMTYVSGFKWEEVDNKLKSY